MAGTMLTELRTKGDAAWANLTRQLQGMEPHMGRSDSPGEWTTREVLSHLLFEPGADPVAFLKKFSDRDLPPGEIEAGNSYLTDERKKMTLRQFVEALDAQRRSVFAYLDGLSDAELAGRKARIPLFKQFTGTDEVPIHVYVGALFDLHWQSHAEQLAKIRKAAGLPEAR